MVIDVAAEISRIDFMVALTRKKKHESVMELKLVFWKFSVDVDLK